MTSEPANADMATAGAADRVPGVAARECGTCTMCCKIMSVWEIEKPNGVWCKHVRDHRACSIYETRPQSCRTFNCLWLRGVGSEAMRPDKSRIVMVEAGGAADPDGAKGFAAILDPSRPLAWREPAMRAFLEQIRDRFGEIGMALGSRQRVFHAGQPLETP